MNLADGLRINSWRCPDKTAVVFQDKRVTYAELNARANRFAHAMADLGIGRGDKVAIILYNCTEFLEIYHGLARLGAVSVPVNFRLVGTEREYIVRNSDAKAVILGTEFVSGLKPGNLPKVAPGFYIAVGPKADVPPGISCYEELLQGRPDSEPVVEASEADLFYFGYTSGTTGFPKGAMIQTRGTLEVVRNAMARNANRADADMAGRVLLAIMPVCHSNSIWATLITFWMGGTNVIFPSGKFDAEGVLATIEREKVTTTSMVPTMITRILELPEEIKSKYDIGSLTSLGSSSAPLLTKTKEEALKYFKNARFSEGYGSTETGALTTLRHKDQLRKIRSIGKPNPGIEIKLVAETGEEVREPGQVGVLWAKAPSAFIGYYKDQAKTREAINGEWSTAGDLAYFDEEGYYFLVDRKNDMIISGGENIYPAEIEEVLSKNPAVSEVAVIGVPHPQWGEEVRALVLLKDGEQVSEQELIEFCRDKLAGYKRPRTIEYVSDFPRTATGKILKRTLRQSYWQGQERAI
ncbi:MAG: AMP-binding protein [Peptococcaceae bacterium]|jgi:long-chain acyl-CoA synthetase|nr:AMP-binding protein [Peptococcaceae bacterium]